MKRWHWVALAALSILVALFAVSFLFPATYQVCAPDDYTHAKSCAPHHFGPFVVLGLVVVADLHNGIVTAIATVFMAGFTATLWFVTNKGLNLARDEFNATHRPRVIVRSFQTLEENGDASVTFLYVNVGDLPAKVVEIRWAVVTRFLADPTFTVAKIVGVTLSSGDKDIFEAQPDGQSEFNFVRGFSEGVGFQGYAVHHTDAYCVGCVIYEDERGRRRETGFCRVSEGSTGPWLKVKDSEYEYQD